LRGATTPQGGEERPDGLLHDPDTHAEGRLARSGRFRGTRGQSLPPGVEPSDRRYFDECPGWWVLLAEPLALFGEVRQSRGRVVVALRVPAAGIDVERGHVARIDEQARGDAEHSPTGLFDRRVDCEDEAVGHSTPPPATGSACPRSARA